MPQSPFSHEALGSTLTPASLLSTTHGSYPTNSFQKNNEETSNMADQRAVDGSFSGHGVESESSQYPGTQWGQREMELANQILD